MGIKEITELVTIEQINYVCEKCGFTSNKMFDVKEHYLTHLNVPKINLEFDEDDCDENDHECQNFIYFFETKFDAEIWVEMHLEETNMYHINWKGAGWYNYYKEIISGRYGYCEYETFINPYSNNHLDDNDQENRESKISEIIKSGQKFKEKYNSNLIESLKNKISNLQNGISKL